VAGQQRLAVRHDAVVTGAEDESGSISGAPGGGPAVSGARRRAGSLAVLRIAAITAALLLVYAAIPLSVAEKARWLPLTVGLLMLGVLLVWQVTQVTRSPFPRVRAVEALGTTVPLFLLLFAASYVATSASDPASFTEPVDRVDAVYFAVTVFATVGFGDITPATQSARAVVTVQMVGGLVLVGLIARVLVGAVEVGLKRREEGSGS
jgi:hypothetical protein